MSTRLLSLRSMVSRLKNAVAAGTSDQDSSVVDLAAGPGWDGVLFVAVLGAVTDGSQLALEVYGSAAADGSSPTLVKATATVTGATSGNKLLSADVSRPGYRYVFARVKRGTQNAAIDAILAVRYDARAIDPGTSLTDANVLAAATYAG